MLLTCPLLSAETVELLPLEDEGMGYEAATMDISSAGGDVCIPLKALVLKISLLMLLTCPLLSAVTVELLPLVFMRLLLWTSHLQVVMSVFHSKPLS